MSAARLTLLNLLRLSFNDSDSDCIVLEIEGKLPPSAFIIALYLLN